MGSRPDVGSSRSRTSGCSARLRAIQRRCCCPPDRALAGSSRRSFDVFEDQKLALDHLQLAIQDLEGDKPNLGEMAREALDNYIRKCAIELPNVRTNHQTAERTDETSSEEDPTYG
jgi:hypothetical protein